MGAALQIFNTRHNLGLLGADQEQAERGRLNPKCSMPFLMGQNPQLNQQPLPMPADFMCLNEVELSLWLN